MAGSPQRFLANNRNLLREAILTPSSVLPVSNKVLALPRARNGSVQVTLTGTYTGFEEATYDVEILDDDIDIGLASAPVFTGAGSGTLENIGATGLVAQEFAVELGDAGIPAVAAGVDFEGVKLAARASGDAGNLVRISIDSSPLVFTPQNWSLLADLKAGDGASTSTGLDGPQYDFDTPVLGVDGQIPASSTDNALGAGLAHRIAFGGDTANIYLQYKVYADGKWSYFFVPELRNDIQAGAKVNFVTGGRTIEVTDGATTRTYTDIVTLFDALDAFKLDALGLIDVVGVIANDRSPTGQAARELQTKTDAHAEASSGSGSKAATGFEGVTVEPDAPTELVIAECFATNSADAIGAGIGHEFWKVKGTVSGELGTAITGEPFVGPKWGFTIPERLPQSSGSAKGKFTFVSFTLGPRVAGDPSPVFVCPVGLKLGPGAVDQTITLIYTKRPDGSCLCDDMPVPDLDGPCLGTLGEGGSVSYSADALERLKDLYDWANSLATAVTTYVAGKDFTGIPSGGDIVGSGTGSQSTQETFQSKGASGSYSMSTALDGGPILGTSGSMVDTGYADVALPANFQGAIDAYEKTLALIDPVLDTTLRADGFSKWDDALTAFKDDLDTTTLASLGNRLATIAGDKYEVLLRQALAYAGVSPLGKSSASGVGSGDGCWQDYGDPFYWEVVGSVNGKYAPAFNNHPYFSSQFGADGKTYRSTKEFAFQINEKCTERLREDDTIVLQINDAATGGTYQVGDTLTLPIIAAQALYMAGGQDGDGVQKWYVSGSVVGALAQFTYNPAAPAPYSDGGLSFDLVPGGIPFQKYDTFRFSIEGGHYRWRKNGGAWSASSPPDDIPAGAFALDSGLSLEFITGAAPSFVAGDIFSFMALQPWAVSNLQRPTAPLWKWSDASPGPTLEGDLGAAEQIDMALFLHTLPEGATLELEGGTSPGIYTWSETITWRPLASWKEIDRIARYVRLSLSDVVDGSIQWAWLGIPLTTGLTADFNLRRAYKMGRSDSGGLIQGARFLGKAVSGEVSWEEGALEEADVANFSDMLDWIKEQGDEPIVVIPQVTRTDEPVLFALIDSDEVDFPDVHGYQPQVGRKRKLSATLPLAGVWR
jgi:hypothetical protein